jgi:hypothetical protein
VTSTRNRSEPRTPLPAPASHGRAVFHVADLLLPASLGLWALGISQTHAAVLGSFGLPGVLPVVFYAGVALLIVSAAIELARGHPSRWRMSVHAVALVVMLYGTAPLVYSQGRYSWLYKTIGVVQYVNAHGQLNRHIDIYQSWPGFFALAAWFGKVAGVASPLAYAKWAQLVFELAALPLLYLIYDALSLTARQRWVALLLYSASNWIGQDYFSPQALGTLFYLGIMAITFRWLYLGNSSGSRRRGQEPDAAGADKPSSRDSIARAERPALLCWTIVLVYFVLTFTHELTPYILAVQLGALAVTGLLRPRWLPVALAAIAVGYLLPRFNYVNSHYGLLNSIGSFFRNAAPPSFEARAVAGSQVLIERCAEALSLGMWGLAVAGAWLNRRSGRTVLGLVVLAFSPFILLAVQHYGNEGILRAYLFSLPWTAALAASALASKPGNHRAARRGDAAFLRFPLASGTLRAPIALGVTLVLFFPAFFGDDSFNVMPQPEVAAVTSFLQSARAGPVYCAIDNAPLADTARYSFYPQRAIFGSNSLLGTSPAKPDIANVIANNSLIYTHGSQPAYVVVAPSMIAYSQAYGVTSSGSFTILLRALARSRTWKLIVHQAGTVIYEVPSVAVRP